MNRFLSAGTWRRMERRAIRAHERDLQHHLAELAATAPTLTEADSSCAPAALVARLDGHRLVLGGVHAPAAAAAAALMASGSEVRLARAGRYGPLWWIAVVSATGEEVTILAGRLRLTHERGRRRPAESTRPADREPSPLSVLAGQG